MNPLWLALHLPCLPLEARAAPSAPSAVVEHGRVVLADRSAQRAGVVCGTGVAAARALLPEIALLARDPAQEAGALRALACWAGAFTPRVSLTADTLLLEIGACLRLFGGLDKIVAAVGAGVSAQNFSAQLAVAPTPLAAQWLAQAGTAARCGELGEMREQLAALPVDVLPADTAAALKRFGARTLGDVRRLPSAALGRRLGSGPLQALARAFGELADPRIDFVFPDQFCLPLQLPATVDSTTALLFAARRLLSALAGWLAARQAGVREFTLRLRHRQGETLLRLHFAELCADRQRFERVLRERLEATTLTAAVEALQLDAAAPAALAGRSGALFEDAGSAQEAIAALLERFVARLGKTRVYRVGSHDDHRPERATRPTALFARMAAGRPATAPRPLWLLDPPQALAEVDGRPWRRGRLRLLGGPERIEAGWWDSDETAGDELENSRVAVGDVRRDYFVALAADGSWLWIYRDCKAPGGWFVHGLFA